MNQRNEPELAAVLPFLPHRSQKTHADSHPLPPRPAVPSGGPKLPEPPRIALVRLAA